MNDFKVSAELDQALIAFAEASRARVIIRRTKKRMANQWRSTLTAREVKELANVLVKSPR